MNFLEHVVELRREPGVSGGKPVSVVGNVGLLEKLVNWVAEADVQIQVLKEDWNFLWRQHELQLSDDILGTGIYEPPQSFGLWDRTSFLLNGSVPLEFVPYRDFRVLERQNGLPEVVTQLPNRKLAVWPIPVELSATKQIPDTLSGDFWASPTRMTGDKSESAIPLRFQRLITLRAKIMYAGYMTNNDMLNLAVAEFSELLGLMESAELPGQRTNTTEQEKPLVMRVH